MTSFVIMELVGIFIVTTIYYFVKEMKKETKRNQNDL